MAYLNGKEILFGVKAVGLGAGLPEVLDAPDGVALVVKNGVWVVGNFPVEHVADSVNEALDGIIAIQEELITGGTVLPMAEGESF